MENTLTLLPSHPFWNFSLETYSQEAPRQTLLYLQNRYGLNVNVVLYCFWYASTNQGQLSKHEIKHILTTIHHWHEHIVLLLRGFRDRLKEVNSVAWAAELRKEILSTEVTAEHIEQLLICNLLAKKPVRTRKTHQQQAANACQNLITYCSVHYITLNQNDCSAIAEFLRAIFTDLNPIEALNLCKSFLLGKPNTKKPTNKQLPLKLTT